MGCHFMHTYAVIRRAVHAPINKTGILWLSLLASIVTLLFCTLPTLLFVFRFDAANTLTQWWPFLITAMNHEQEVFAISGALLVAAAWTLWNMDTRHCPPDPELARQYRHLRHWNRWILKLSAAFWLAGIIATFIVPPIRMALGW